MGNTIVVIGGGASGLMAGITAARAGAKVTILEQNNRLGKKILSTGNGRCNMTNMDQARDRYRCTDPDFPIKVLKHLTVDQTLSFFQQIGIFTKNKNGYVYPRSNQAACVADALILEAERLKIKCKTREKVHKIEKKQSGFLIHTETWHYECDHVIVACGSKASVVDGADGSGYELMKAVGHTIQKPLPALTGLKGVGSWFSKWAGVRCEGRIRLFVDEIQTHSDIGEIQLTDYGISGIPVFQISRYAARALDEKKQVKVRIDFVPDMTKEELFDRLKQVWEFDTNRNIKNLLIGFLPQKLVDVVCSQAENLSESVNLIKGFDLSIREVMDYAHAQVCTGGVCCQELDSDTMESKLVPGMYLCGELTDVDGACGGYNLQWAWSSGYLAGSSAAKELL